MRALKLLELAAEEQKEILYLLSYTAPDGTPHPWAQPPHEEAKPCALATSIEWSSTL